MEKEQIVISVENVKKSFKVYYDRSKTLKDLLSLPGKGQHKTREVLKGITFQVKKGEAIALVGKNGCGKSTMLKLLTRIIYPDSGSIKVNGKVSSLLELGAGFHPDMSGRENIYLNASVFGLSRKEIDRKVDEIIEFSELDKFIDNPVRTYSSGMYMRLAFSVAINVQAEILLIDEILGVGDVRFQRKCFNKLKEIKNNGATIVIVSHSMSQIEQICDKCIWICDGIVKEEGEPKIISKHYYQHMGVEVEEKKADKVNLKTENKENVIPVMKDSITIDKNVLRVDNEKLEESISSQQEKDVEKTEIEKLHEQIHSLKEWISELENGKTWLEQHSVDMENYIRDLEEGKMWLEQHAMDMESYIKELEEQV